MIFWTDHSPFLFFVGRYEPRRMCPHTHTKKNIQMELFHTTLGFHFTITTALFKVLIFAYLACHGK